MPWFDWVDGKNILNPFKLLWCTFWYSGIVISGRPFNPIQREIDPRFRILLERMLDFNQDTRADINEVIDILEKIKSDSEGKKM